MSTPQRGHVYRHYKGDFYVVDCIHHRENPLSSTHPILIVNYCRPRDRSEFSRRQDEWESMASVDGVNVERYVEIDIVALFERLRAAEQDRDAVIRAHDITRAKCLEMEQTIRQLKGTV